MSVFDCTLNICILILIHLVNSQHHVSLKALFNTGDWRRLVSMQRLYLSKFHEN